MDLKQAVVAIKDQISSGNLKEALEATIVLLKTSDSNLESEMILLSNRFHQLNANRRRDTISLSEYNLHSNKIVDTFLQLLNEVSKDGVTRTFLDSANHPTIHRVPTIDSNFLEETLKRHEQQENREMKRWVLTHQNEDILEIITYDRNAQGAFYKKEKQITLGRSPESDIIIQNPYISRQHTKIYFDQNAIWIKDHKSSNMTFLNNRQITNEHEAENGMLKLDQVVFHLGILQ